MRRGLLALGLALISALASAGAPAWHWDLPQDVAPPPVPADNPMSAAKVELGRRLFYDADLSADGTMSCAGCHEQHHAFAHPSATRPGVTGEPGRRNVPGLANVGWASPLTFADPGLTTLEAQASVPVLGTHPVEMGMAGREHEIATRLGKDACYRAMFREAFPEARGEIAFVTVAKALASFQRTFTSFGSDFDRDRLTAQASEGLTLFTRDCAACHAGPMFTDLAFYRIGAEGADPGLAEKTSRPEDRGKVRTPSLRNVALTGPWWHDGTATTLTETVARHGLAHDAEDQARLLAFLAALNDGEFTTRASLALPDRACGKPL